MYQSFDVDFAVEYGINAAIIFKELAWWCEHNRANGQNFFDGFYWTFNSMKAFQKLFPYLGEKQIRNSVDVLVNAGLIKTGNYNKNAFDRTMWYAVTDEGREAFLRNGGLDSAKGQMDKTETANGDSQEGEPIPSINTSINTYNTKDEEDARARACTREGNTVDDIPNAFGDGDIPHDGNTIQQYVASNLQCMSARAIEELWSFLDDLPEPVVRHGIDNALDAGKRTWNYVRAILNSYAEEGVKTVAEAVEVDKRITNKKYTQAKATPQKKTAAQESDEFWGRVQRF